MKKCEAFHMAQLSVLADELIGNEEKLKIIRVLQTAEDSAKFAETVFGKEED